MSANFHAAVSAVFVLLGYLLSTKYLQECHLEWAGDDICFYWDS